MNVQISKILKIQFLIFIFVRFIVFRCRNLHLICAECARKHFEVICSNRTRENFLLDSCYLCRTPYTFERPITVNQRDDSTFTIVKNFNSVDKKIKLYIWKAELTIRRLLRQLKCCILKKKYRTIITLFKKNKKVIAGKQELTGSQELKRI